MMHQRWWNSVAKPASGPLCSVPATGCAGMIVRPGRVSASAHHRIGRERAGDGLRRFAHRADRHAQDHQIGAGDRVGGAVADLVRQRAFAGAAAHRGIAVVTAGDHAG